jgi:hypothetical protein
MRVHRRRGQPFLDHITAETSASSQPIFCPPGAGRRFVIRASAQFSHAFPFHSLPVTSQAGDPEPSSLSHPARRDLVRLASYLECQGESDAPKSARLPSSRHRSGWFVMSYGAALAAAIFHSLPCRIAVHGALVGLASALVSYQITVLGTCRPLFRATLASSAKSLALTPSHVCARSRVVPTGRHVRLWGTARIARDNLSYAAAPQELRPPAFPAGTA